ncbi:hypothetical protein M431DRAFT_81722, partial [Trichoderma harzianum CBS 226.95]
EEEFIRLTKVEGLVSETEAEQVFNQLKPIAPSFLIGKWKGGDLNRAYFRSENDGDPIMVLDEQGNRIWNKDWGHCLLREMVFRGVTSTAMIYDEKPIFDHFRYINENVVAGAMDCPKVFGSESTYYFYLTRLE